MVPIALTIAGSDSGGGAGIQADLKTFHRFGVYGTSAIVALTAQNTRGVTAVEPSSAEMVEAQLTALADDLPPHALKTGMLATSPLVRQVARAIDRYAWARYVLDPVMVATSGARLLDPEAEGEIVARLVPLALVVTPNLDEASLLVGFPVRDPESMERAGRRLIELGAGSALIKGGHLEGAELVDVLVGPEGAERFAHRRIETRSTHGTGCTLSAAITAGLARWASEAGAASGTVPPFDRLRSIVADGLGYLRRAIETAPGLGGGNGPVNHWAG